MGTKILLVGCGKMGGAMMRGWIDKGFDPGGITVIEPTPETAEAIERRHPVRAFTDAAELPDGYAPDVVVLAVKPQMMEDVAPAYRAYAGAAVVLSIAAGRTVASFERIFGDTAPIVRCMPNTPAAVGRGALVACANDRVDAGQQRLCHDLLSAVGECHWVDDEGLMDAVTAVSGSGPAYVFLLAECLADAGREAGLPDELADRLARLTVTGAAELLRTSADPAAVLRQNVTSPGGTTAAALDVLMGDHGMKVLLQRAVDAAAARSKELAG